MSECTPQIQKMLDSLNAAFKADPAAMHALLMNRIPCNKALADHPHIPVDTHPILEGSSFESGPWFVGAMGIICGILDSMSLPLIASKWSEPDAEGRRKLEGFCEYAPREATHATE